MEPDRNEAEDGDMAEVREVASRLNDAIDAYMGDEQVRWHILMAGLSLIAGGLLAHTSEPGAQHWCNMALAAREQFIMARDNSSDETPAG